MKRAMPQSTLALAFGLIAGAAILPSPASADGLITTHRIPASTAARIVSAAVEACAAKGYAETAVVVDADGVRQAVLRGDKAGYHGLDSAFDKAYTAGTFKADTSVLVERAKTAPSFANLFTQLPHLLLFGGGVVIKSGDEVIGAVGAAGAPGADLDDGCAKAGLDAVRDQLK
jgi:uncharacterized protein GlcG (DUF336 family)